MPERAVRPSRANQCRLLSLGICLILGLMSLSLAGESTTVRRALDNVPPRPAREFRGAWIATVANLDWPSRPGLATAVQKSELVAIIEKAAQLRLNVLIFQVRSGADAMYSSPIEPWSEFLSGQMGTAPDPPYDPLAFAIEEAHRRGLELHAWFNPFRVRSPVFKSGAATNHLTRTRPEWVRNYGSQIWLDPGLSAVRDHATRVVLDVVQRYDIDGVHLDDYFYPYPERNTAGQLLEFPDDISWQRYRAGGGKLVRADWRRKNIDDFIEALNRRIKLEKRWVKLGISPFGIWRLGAPAGVRRGLDAYEYLYADSRKWLAQGWADYFAPQLYWSIESPDQSYKTLVEWWSSQNTRSRLVCPGNDLTKVGSAWPSSEILKQVRLTRKQRGATGNVFWNISSLIRNPDRLADSILRELYTEPALVPAASWLTDGFPDKPKLTLDSPGNSKAGKVTWGNAGPRPVRLWVCQVQRGGKWSTELLPKDRTTLPLPDPKSPQYPDAVAVTAIDRYGGASPTAVVYPKPIQLPPLESRKGDAETNAPAKPSAQLKRD